MNYPCSSAIRTYSENENLFRIRLYITTDTNLNSQACTAEWKIDNVWTMSHDDIEDIIHSKSARLNYRWMVLYSIDQHIKKVTAIRTYKTLIKSKDIGNVIVNLLRDVILSCLLQISVMNSWYKPHIFFRTALLCVIFRKKVRKFRNKKNSRHTEFCFPLTKIRGVHLNKLLHSTFHLLYEKHRNYIKECLDFSQDQDNWSLYDCSLRSLLHERTSFWEDLEILFEVVLQNLFSWLWRFFSTQDDIRSWNSRMIRCTVFLVR